MANEYFVNSTDLTSVADAIRTKGETTEKLVFPGGFVAAIETMETGKTGATLTVTTPAEGITVTVTKGELSYTKITGADGTAVFSGLETGTWTITISDGSQTATGTVDIDADYAANMTFFSATINVTYPTGLVCTATDGVTTLTAPDTSGTWACIVPNAGTWTVSMDNGFSESVEITQSGEVKTVDKWYLYKSGDERTSITGGWLNYYNKGVSKNTDSISITAVTGTESRYRIRTNSTINLAPYKTMYIECTHGNSGTYNNGGVIVSTSSGKGSYPEEGGDAVIVAPKTNATKVIYSVDIENLSGNYYIFVTSGYQASFTMYRLWVC
jgi:hypothetical protein